MIALKTNDLGDLHDAPKFAISMAIKRQSDRKTIKICDLNHYDYISTGGYRVSCDDCGYYGFWEITYAISREDQGDRTCTLQK